MKSRELSVVLTGATGRVGSVLARALVARGARVLLVARTASELAALARDLGAEHDHRNRIDALACDVTSAGARLGLIEAAAARDANVLINAACADGFGPLADVDARRAEMVLQTNLVAAVQLTRALLPHLLRQHEARIFHLGSTLGRSESPGTAVYAAGRYGLQGFSESLQRELGKTNVHVQFFAPNGTDAAPDHIARTVVRMLLSGSPRLGRLTAWLPLWTIPT